MWGVVPVSEKKCQNPVTDPKNLERSHILYGMVTCHSLTIIDGKLSGDPLDLKVSRREREKKNRSVGR